MVNTVKGGASLGKSMLLVTHSNDFVKFYISYGVYRINKEGELYMLYISKMYDFPVLFYYIKKRDSEKGRVIHLEIGFKKSLNAYFTEDPELLKRVNDGELTFRDIDEIIETYMETTKTL